MRYEIFGPFIVPVMKKPSGGKYLSPNLKNAVVDLMEKDTPDLSTAKGCYVFSIRAGLGYKPWYVGKTNAKKGFAGECFGSHQRDHYTNALAEYKRGTPVLHVIARVTSRGNIAKNADPQETKFLEQFLIGLAINQNAKLRNTATTKFYRDLIVPGILNTSGPGTHGNSRKTLHRSLGVA